MELYAFKSKESEKLFIFFLSGNTMTTYEINQRAEAINQRLYQAEFFGKQNIFIEEIIVIPGNKILILDFYSGLIEVVYSEGEIGKLYGQQGLN